MPFRRSETSSVQMCLHYTPTCLTGYLGVVIEDLDLGELTDM